MIPAEIINNALIQSTDALISVVFGHSRSKNFEAALNIAMQAETFQKIEIGGSRFYLSSFGLSLPQASLSLLLLNLATNWKGTHVFLKGTPITNLYNIISTLECFQNSMRCADSKAYCHTIQKTMGEQSHSYSMSYKINISVERDHPLDKILPKEEQKPIPLWIHPCKKLSYYSRDLNPLHPSSLQDQLQAQAVSHGCDICPNFKPNDLREI